MSNHQFSKQTARMPDGGGFPFSDEKPYWDLGPSQRAPKLALVANPHGNELNGLFVLARLAAFLETIQAGKLEGLRLRERIVIIPAMVGSNPVVAPIWRKKRSRMKQKCSDSGAGTLEAVAELTRTAYYRVDLHPAAPEMEEMPQVRLYAPNDDERATACLFGLPAVIERPATDDATSGLMRIWRAQGGENFVIHAGQAGSLQTSHCETLFHGLTVFLDRTGIISGLRLADDDEDLRYFGLDQVVNVEAEQSGLFASGLEVGRWVQTGEVLGQIYDSLTGGIQAQVLAPVAGLLASLRRQPLLQPGNLVARILTPAVAVQRRSARSGEQTHGRWISRRA